MLVKQWEDVADLWYKKDDKFKKPKATVACKIYTDDLMFGQSTQTTVFAEMWKRCLQEVLREFLYMADQAKLEFSFTMAIDNIDLKWSGFNDKFVNFVTETLQKINGFRDMEILEIFNQAKEKLAQDWKNYYLNQVFRLAHSELDRIVISNF